MNPDLPIDGHELTAEALLSYIYPAVSVAFNHHHRNPDEVKEIGQRVFFRLAKNDYHLLRTFDSQKGALASWLKPIAAHEVSGYLQERGQFQSLEEYAERDNQSLEETRPDFFTCPSAQEETLLEGEQLLLLLALTQCLPPREQQAIELARRDDLSDGDRAALMGLKESSFRTLKSQAIKKLREMVEKPSKGRCPKLGRKKSRKNRD